MTEDAELLCRFVEARSNSDFTEFVTRHFNFVYHAALRRSGGRTDLAEEAAQYVFTAAAQQARALRHHQSIVGWLHTTTRHAVNSLLRTERRRLAREREASLMNDTSFGSDAAPWHRVRQELDCLMDELPARDREAILLRYFHSRTFAQIGAASGLNEDAARKRVDRAVERLRQKLARRGLTSTTAALGAMLAGEAALAAPANLATTVAGAAILQAAGTSSAMGLLPLMSLKTTLGTATALGIAGVLALITLGVAVHATLAARAAELGLDAANREYDARVAMLGKLQRDAAAAETHLAEAQASAPSPARNADPAAESAAQQTRERRANGKKFLDTVPEASALARASIYSWLRNYCPQFYRTAHLTAAQIEEFENMATAGRLETLEIWREGSSFRWNIESKIPVELVRQRFGPDIAQQFEENRRMYGGNFVASGVAIYAARAGVPLSDHQIDEIARVTAENNRDYRAGKLMGSSSLASPAQDWNATMEAARRILSPQQWHAAEYELVYYQFRQALKQASESMQEAAANKSKS